MSVAVDSARLHKKRASRPAFRELSFVLARHVSRAVGLRLPVSAES